MMSSKSFLLHWSLALSLHFSSGGCILKHIQTNQFGINHKIDYRKNYIKYIQRSHACMVPTSVLLALGE